MSNQANPLSSRWWLSAGCSTASPLCYNRPRQTGLVRTPGSCHSPETFQKQEVAHDRNHNAQATQRREIAEQHRKNSSSARKLPLATLLL